jgi:hypothetical protein
MKKVELTDEELTFLIELCDKVTIPGKIARELVPLQDKLVAAQKEGK